MKPSKTWSLEKLATFCQHRLRRTAEDAHDIGTALIIARERHRTSREWCKWLASHVQISQATAYRYISLAKQSAEDVRGKPLCKIYSASSSFSWAVEDEQEPQPDQLASIVQSLTEYIDRLSGDRRRRLETILRQLEREQEQERKRSA